MEDRALWVVTAYPVEVRCKDSYHVVTCRKGRVLAAYYYLPRREGDQ